MVVGEEVVLRVSVSYPGNPGRELQEWLVLGTQRLSELRDALYCRSDCDMQALGMQRPSGESPRALHPSDMTSSYMWHLSRVQGERFGEQL